MHNWCRYDEELSEDIREGLEVHFVSTYDEVYKHALAWE